MEKIAPLVLFILVGLVAKIAVDTSNFIGSHFYTTAIALAKSSIVIMILALLSRFAQTGFFLLLGLTSPLIWYFWWEVIESAAIGGKDPNGYGFLVPGWVSPVQISVGFALLFFAAWLAKREWLD